MYGIFGKVNSPKRKWPSDRAIALRHIVDVNTSNIYSNSDILKSSLLEAKLPIVSIKQLELALTSETLRNLLNSGDKNLTAIEINNALFSIENCGIADDDARDILEDLLYSVNVSNELKDYSSVKEALANKKTLKYIPPQVYRKKLTEIMGFVSAEDNEKLTSEIQEELNMYAECNIGEANYILSLMYNKGIGVKKDKTLAYKYAQKAAAGGYPPAYAMLGDVEYNNNRFDEAYAYYAKPGAIALDKKRSSRMDNLFKAKKFANKVCIVLGIIYAMLIATMVFVINGLSLAGGHPFLLMTFIILMTIMMAYIIYVHFKKPLRDMRHWGIAFALLFFVYLVFALV